MTSCESQQCEHKFGHYFLKSLHVVEKMQSNLELLYALENDELWDGVQYPWENLNMLHIDVRCHSPVLSRSL